MRIIIKDNLIVDKNEPQPLEKTTTAPETPVKSQGLSATKLNFILALCAMLISAASFYATYLQANAAEKQVKAMTLPLLQFGTSNYNPETNQKKISFVIKNGGVGPALIKSIKYQYDDIETKDIFQFLRDCCQANLEKFDNLFKITAGLKQGGYATSRVNHTILTAQDEVQFFMLYHGKDSKNLWEQLNVERRRLSVEICYCSLLDDCFVTNGINKVEPIKMCAVDQ